VQDRGKAAATAPCLRSGAEKRSVFLYGFAKSERANIDHDELEALRDIARTYLELDVKKIEAAIAAGELLEVGYGEKE
jgi:hypothetical protein